MDYLLAFVCGGAICIVGQLLLDIFKLTPAHVMTSFVVIGAILDGFGIYDKFIEFAGGGATVPIVSFGHSLLHGAMHQAHIHGFIVMSALSFRFENNSYKKGEENGG